MAGIGSTVLGALVNRVAFTGAGHLFKMLDHNGYLAESKRHNAALEKLAKAREAFRESEIRKKDGIAQLKEELATANQDETFANQALKELAQLQRQARHLCYPTITNQVVKCKTIKRLHHVQ